MAYLNFSFVFIWLKSSLCKIRQLTNLNLVDVHGLDIIIFFTFYSCLVVGLNLQVAKDSIRFTLYKYKGFTVEYFGHHRHCIYLAGANRHPFFVELNAYQSTFYIDLAIYHSHVVHWPYQSTLLDIVLDHLKVTLTLLARVILSFGSWILRQAKYCRCHGN